MNQIQFGKLATISIIFGLILLFSPNISFADKTIVTPLDLEIALEKTETTLSIDKTDSHQWAFVEGKIAHPVTGHPVIIQILKDNEFVRIAQVDVDDHGNYEYKFRVKTIDGPNTTQIFEGDYLVKIFKVVKSPYHVF